jgi:hypothetical protein
MTCYSDNETAFAYCAAGTGSTAPQQYMVYHNTDITDPSPIQDGDTLFIKNAQTGKFCQ